MPDIEELTSCPELFVIVPDSRFAALEVPATSFASSENLLFIDYVFVLWLTLIVSSLYASRCCIICRSVLRSFVFDSIVEFFPDLKGISGERLFCSNECLTGWLLFGLGNCFQFVFGPKILPGICPTCFAFLTELGKIYLCIYLDIVPVSEMSLSFPDFQMLHSRPFCTGICCGRFNILIITCDVVSCPFFVQSIECTP